MPPQERWVARGSRTRGPRSRGQARGRERHSQPHAAHAKGGRCRTRLPLVSTPSFSPTTSHGVRMRYESSTATIVAPWRSVAWAPRFGGRPVIRPRKAIALLLISRSPTARSREALCGLLWPAHDMDRARGALRRTLSALRSAIGEEWIDAAGDIALKRGPVSKLGVRRFRELAAERILEPERGGDAVLSDFWRASRSGGPDFTTADGPIPRPRAGRGCVAWWHCRC
jgi:hypothetical protein